MKLVDFYGDKLEVVEMNGGPGVAARRLVENLGLSWARQSEKLQDPMFSCSVIRTHDITDREQEMLVMPVRSLPAFLFSINPKKVREDLREKLGRYRLECVDVLYQYWAKGYAINPRPTVESSLEDYLSGTGKAHFAFLDGMLEAGSNGPEHREVMATVIDRIMCEALEVEEVDIERNFVHRKQGWACMTPVEITVAQAVESEIGLYFAKNGVPANAEGVMEMGQQVGRKVTSRLRKAMFVSETFSEKFETSLFDLLGMKETA